MSIPTHLTRGELLVIQTGKSAPDDAWLHGPFVAQRDMSAQELADGFAAWVRDNGEVAVTEAAEANDSVLRGNYASEDRHETAFVQWLQATGLLVRVPCKSLEVGTRHVHGRGMTFEVEDARASLPEPFPGPLGLFSR